MTETTLHGKRITNSTIEATKISATLDQFNAPVAPLNLNSQKITGLADPVANTDADTKGARDAAIAAALVGGVQFVTNETPTGLVNGINTTYTLANTPIAGSEQLYISGLALSNPNDYTIVTNTITTVSPPSTGESIKVSYRY